MKARLEEAILGTIGARQEMVRRCRGMPHWITVMNVCVCDCVSDCVCGVDLSDLMEIVICLLFQKGVPTVAKKTLGGGRMSLTGDKIQTELISM